MELCPCLGVTPAGKLVQLRKTAHAFPVAAFAQPHRNGRAPGMLHCGGGVGPSNVDWVADLDAWVTAGKAPGDVTATGGPGQAPGGPPSQVLCPDPSVAKKTGEAWACAVPAKKTG